jgi:hypothetical protein
LGWQAAHAARPADRTYQDSVGGGDHLPRARHAGGGGTSDELEIKRLRKLWAAWPGTILDEAPKKAGGIALWYEQCDDRKYFKVNMKPYALCYLTEILKANPEIVKIDIDDGGPEYLAANLHGTIEHKMGQTELWAEGLA